MAVLTPGAVYLLTVVPKLLSPPVIAYLALQALRQLSGARISSWTLALSCVASLPIFYWIRALYSYVQEELGIRTLGAVRVPKVKGKYPGSLDLILKRLKQGKDGYPYEPLDGLTRQYGKIFNVKSMGENKFVTCDPTHFKIILSTDFNGWEKGDRFRRQMGSVLGSGVFNSDGEMWKFHRSMSRPFFSRDRISDFALFARHADVALSAMRARTRSGSPIDFQDVMFRFALDSATEFLFGSCVHSLRAILPGASGATAQVADVGDTFGKALAGVQYRLGQRARLAPLWPLFEIFSDKTSKDMKILNQFVEPIIQEALNRKQGLKAGSKHVEENGTSERQTLLDQLIEMTDDVKLIADETINILIAGRDTTAATTSFLTYFLALHPHVLKRLREEILDRVGSTRYPDLDDLREMKYLRAVINETLRLFPAVPSNIRSPVKATTLPSPVPGGKPFYIPAHSNVSYQVLHMQRNKELWGPDADVFDPDRFLDERLNKYLVPNPFIFIPFNAGPRICLGQQFAYNEMSFFVVRLLQSFDRIELAPDAQPAYSLPPASWVSGSGRKAVEKIRPKHELTMYVQGGLWVRFGEALSEA
ncbi:hypothetical protein AcW1_007802 [Taiwanofungus camphoratus]|nr:hypothetical protein AcW2_010378 [Antrodia cinnamomea]KAI0953628.1 hypothetical protein AcW1_007802 [Antrodia cinnamomea]